MKNIPHRLLALLVVWLAASTPAWALRDLKSGTYLTRDPIGFAGGTNQYTYVRQNPWTKTDPLGLLTSGTITSPSPDGEHYFPGFKSPYPIDFTPQLTPRQAGVVGAVGSGMEMVAGVATLETGFGGIAAVHGADNLGANLAQIITGKRATSVTETIITQATGSEKAGIIGNAAIGLSAPIGAGLVASKMASAEARVAILMTEDAKVASAAATPVKTAQQTVYGPFHRLGDSPEIVEKIKATGQLEGSPPWNWNTPAVQAHPGPVPAGASRGWEFTTTIPPDPGQPGFFTGHMWTGPRPGVAVEPFEKASIPVTITKVNPAPKAESTVINNN